MTLLVSVLCCCVNNARISQVLRHRAPDAGPIFVHAQPGAQGDHSDVDRQSHPGHANVVDTGEPSFVFIIYNDLPRSRYTFSTSIWRFLMQCIIKTQHLTNYRMVFHDFFWNCWHRLRVLFSKIKLSILLAACSLVFSKAIEFWDERIQQFHFLAQTLFSVKYCLLNFFLNYPSAGGCLRYVLLTQMLLPKKKTLLDNERVVVMKEWFEAVVFQFVGLIRALSSTRKRGQNERTSSRTRRQSVLHYRPFIYLE